jgi:alpha-1,2-mannosyltransferase
MSRSPRWRGWLLFAGLAAIFVAVNAGNALHKGGDAKVFFEGGRRALERQPLYVGSGPANGFIGPPFQALFFTPFAAVDTISRPAAELLWYTLNLAALALGIVLWFRALGPVPDGRDTARASDVRSAWPAVVAVLFPLQTNFEHQNMNALLLALLGAAAWSLQNGRLAAAGAWVGAATALKAFPALLIVYLVFAGFPRAALTAMATAAVLGAVPAIVYGPAGLWQQWTAWFSVSAGGWPVRGQNQSLLAALDRAGGAISESGIGTRTDSPIAFGIYVLMSVALLVCAVVTFRRRPQGVTLYAQVAAAIVLAVVLSPVAWDHYWVLMFPAFLMLHRATDQRLLGTAGQIAFWTAAVLTSGLSRPTVGASGLNLARHLSVNTVAAIVLFVALLVVLRMLERSPLAFGKTASLAKPPRLG